MKLQPSWPATGHQLLVIFVIVVGALLLTRWYLHPGVPYTHDGENHLARFANYKIALKEGQLPPRWAPNLFNRYGYPVFNYNYPLANILSLPFSALKIPYEVTFKVLMSLSVIAILAGTYVWTRELVPTQSIVARSLSVLVMALQPYLVSAIVYRGSIGEVMALGFLAGLGAVIASRVPFKQLLIVVLWSGLLLSHNVTAVFGTVFLLAYIGLKEWGNGAVVLQYLRSLFIAVLLTLWFWLPALAEKSLVILDQAGLSLLASQHAITWSQLLWSPLSFGFSIIGPIDSLGLSAGLVALITLLLVSLMAFEFRLPLSKNKLVLALITATWILYLLQLDFVARLWHVIPGIRFIQFPWRLGLFTTLTSSLLFSWFWHHSRRPAKTMVLVVIVWQLVSVLRTSPVDYLHRSNIDHDAFSQSTSTANENLPHAFTYLNVGDWQPTAIDLAQTAQIKITTWTGSYREYTVQATQAATVVEPTMAFAGWETKITDGQGQHTKASYLDSKQIAGRLAYALEPGQYRVMTRFTQNTWPRLVGNMVSLCTFICVILWLGYCSLKLYNQRNHSA